MLYIGTLLAETLAVAEARAELTEQVLRDPRLGDTLRRRVSDHLTYLDPVGLAGVLVAGLAHEELRLSWDRPGGLEYTLMDRQEFVIDPAAEPAIHPGLLRVDQRPRRGDQSGHAGATATGHRVRRTPGGPGYRRVSWRPSRPCFARRAAPSRSAGSASVAA